MVIAAERPIFIVGMPRSGTTLLTSLLSAHPRIAISPESHFLTYWLPTYGHLIEQPDKFQQFWQMLSHSKRFSYFDIDPETTLANILAKGPPTAVNIFAGWLETYGNRRGKPRWGEKTPLHYQHLEQLLAWFPHAQVLWLLRDPRAVSASLLRMNWASNYVHIHAEQWCQSTQLYEQRWQTDGRVKLVQYEALVQQPQAVLDSIFEFLQEDLPEDLVNQRSTADMPLVNRQGWALDHLNQSLQPMDAIAVDRWKQQLSPSYVAIVNSLTHGVQQRYGYAQGDCSPLSLVSKLLLQSEKLRWKVDRKLLVWRTRWFGVSPRRGREIGAEVV
ncbi:sulfotransferase family protein [Leptothoe kymatousa]|uniref:Sulfotransferase n=1 Tax=Leptothoe kymatousa TAU-MAC 1615 TaxID=2364775 RepID=A0ABS5Y577_9CYAN|nr:sulfotransferase [Leptothoe kymatousa]MBT9312509.1 sulfotransferase [Leptothoe kymatousa TAU-MAC 1615]